MIDKDFLALIEHQPMVADSSLFYGPSFPKIDFLNRDLILAALGTYTLTMRYFDADWNEVQEPTKTGRYGAWVQIDFPNGISATRRLTLFKTATGYNPVQDPFQLVVQYPSAFGLSKDVVDREAWNTNHFINRLLENEGRQNDFLAVLAATMHDFAEDTTRWHGFNYWAPQEYWWTGLEKKLGLSQNYQRLVTVPLDYEKNIDLKWPMILFLHGTYECGDDLNLLTSQGPEGYSNQGHSLPFILVSPQCPKGNSWSPERLMRLIEQIESSYRVDASRIYVTGLSMGGFSTFDLAASHPGKFAAIAPVSAGENPEMVDRLKGVPLWIFHGAEDRIVSPQDSIEIAERMRKLGGEAKLTIYPGGHEGWEKIYADPALYEWFLQHSTTAKAEADSLIKSQL
jgi:pimeloyl-ACP methyl ester carboxylesterase